MPHRFQKLNLVFLFCYIIYPWIRARPFISTYSNVLYPRILCAKFGWNWSSCFWEENFKKLSIMFSLMWLLYPLGKYMVFHLNEFEKSLPNVTLCQVRMTLPLRFCRRFRPCIYTLSLWSPFMKKARTLHLNETELPLPRNVRCQYWLEYVQWVCRRIHCVASISLLQRMEPSFEQTLNVYAKYGWNWLNDSGEVDLWKDIDIHFNGHTDSTDFLQS